MQNQKQVSPDLRRSRENRMIFGVASGLGDYFAIDVAIVRVIFVVTAFLSLGITLLIYFLLAIFMPEQEKANDSETSVERSLSRSDETQLVESRQRFGAWLIIGLGALLLAANLGWFQWFSIGRFWPLLLIAFGVVLLAGVFRGKPESR